MRRIESTEILANHGNVQRRAILDLNRYCYPKLLKLLDNQPEAEQLAKDIIQDAITIAYHNVKKGLFRGDASLTTYTFTICKRLWINEIRKKSQFKSVRLSQQHDKENELHYNEELNIQLFEKVFDQLKDDCQNILKNFYFDQKTHAGNQSGFWVGQRPGSQKQKSTMHEKIV